MSPEVPTAPRALVVYGATGACELSVRALIRAEKSSIDPSEFQEVGYGFVDGGPFIHDSEIDEFIHLYVE